MKISDFAAHSGLSPDTIRYYERIGLLPRTVRDQGGRRSYGMDDLAWASFLRKLQAMDMPIRDRLEYSRLRTKGSATIAERCAMLEIHRATLAARQTELAGLILSLDEKIAHYRSVEADTKGKWHDGSTISDDSNSSAAFGGNAGDGADHDT